MKRFLKKILLITTNKKIFTRLKPKAHTIRFIRPCVSCDPCVICGFFLQVTQNALYAIGCLISCWILRKMENQIVILKEFMELIIHVYEFTYMTVCAAKAYKRGSKERKRSFSVNLFSIFLVYKLINSKEMTRST